jgi:hypothetical protein
MFATWSCTFVLSLAVLTGTTAKTQTPSFTPDGSFQGSSLAGWHTLGQAAWRASDGVVTGDGDGAIDIVTSTRSGTYIFWGTPNGTHQKK